MKKQMSLVFVLLLTSQPSLADNPCKEERSTSLDSQPPNLLMTPEFSNSRLKDKPKRAQSPLLEKLQYEPTTEGTPLLQEREGELERTSGVEYNSGTEVFIAPISDFIVKDEEVHELPVQPVQ